MKIQFDTPPMSAEMSNEVPISYPSGKRSLSRWRWYLLLALVLALPVFFLIRFAVATLIRTTPAMVVMDQVVMRAPLSGTVQFLVGEHTVVKEGQVVARLVGEGAGEMAVDTGAATTALANEAARRQGLQKALTLAGQQLVILQERLRLLERLHAQRAATRQEVEGVRLQSLQTEEKMAGIRADLTKKETPPSAPVSGERIVEMVAPATGTVTKCFCRLGGWLAASDELLVLQTQKQPMIEVFLSPAHVEYATPGQRARLLFMNGLRLDASVEEILPETRRLPIERVGALTAETSTVVVLLKPLVPLPAALQVHHLPLDVHFESDWRHWFAVAHWF